MLKKLAIAIAIVGIWAATIGIATPAQAVLKGGTFTVCHYNVADVFDSNGNLIAAAGTYTPVGVTFTDQAAAQAMGGHIYDTSASNASDIWPATTYSDTYTETNIPASRNWLVQQLTTFKLWNRQHTSYVIVTRYMWVANPVTQAIFANNCVAP